jgi:hypothetical protein
VGSDEIGSSEYPSKPSRRTPTMSSEVAIGRLIKGSETFIRLVELVIGGDQLLLVLLSGPAGTDAYRLD